MSPPRVFIILMLAATVANAQPYVNNANVLPVYNYIAPHLNMTQGASSGIVHFGNGWVFTATYDGVYGMNSNLPAYNNVNVPFFDALRGVTQLFKSNERALLAIADDTIVLYQLNATTVWRQAVYQQDGISFDVQQYGYCVSDCFPAVLNPLIVGSQLVIGTQNYHDSFSQVFSFNTTTLALLWNTTIEYDTTSFAAVSSSPFEHVYIAAQNTVSVSVNSNLYVFKLRLDDGSIDSTPLNTAAPEFAVIGVSNEQLVVSSLYTITFYDSETFTQLRPQVSSSYAFSILYPPMFIDNTWYVLSSEQLNAFDGTTLDKLAWSPIQFDDSALGLAVTEPAQNLVILDGCNVWLANTSGISLMTEFTQQVQQPAPCSPIAASFQTVQWGDISTAFLHLSYQTNGNGGTVITMDYDKGTFVSQATGNFNPIGPAVLDVKERRLYSASMVWGIVQGFAFHTTKNKNNFVATIPSNENQTNGFGFLYNASSKSSYYITMNSLYLIDSIGNVEKVATLLNDFPYVNNNPLIIGQYFVFIASQTVDNDYNNVMCVYDAHTKTIATVQWCGSNIQEPIVVGTIVYTNCPGSDVGAVASIDVSRTPLTVQSYGQNYGRDVSVNENFLVYVEEAHNMCVYDLTHEKLLWETWLTFYSAPVLYRNEGEYNFVFVVGNATATSTVPSLLIIDPSTDGITEIAPLFNASSVQYTIVVKEGGVFGTPGFIYCIGTYNVTAFSMVDDNQVFSYTIDTVTYGPMFEPAAVMDSGVIVLFMSNDYLLVLNALTGDLMWSYSGVIWSVFPFTSDSRNIYFMNYNQVVGVDIMTGAVTSVTSFGMQNAFGYAIDAGLNETTVISADGYIVFAVTTLL